MLLLFCFKYLSFGVFRADRCFDAPDSSAVFVPSSISNNIFKDLTLCCLFSLCFFLTFNVDYFTPDEIILPEVSVY